MGSQIYVLFSILLYFSSAAGQVIVRNVAQEEVPDGVVAMPPSRQLVSVKINGTVYELDSRVCTGGVMMKRRVPVEEFCGVGVFSTRPSGCSSDQERFIGVDDQYTCSRLMSGIQGFLRVVVEDEFTTTEGALSSTEDLITTTDVTEFSTEADTTKRVEISAEAVNTNGFEISTEEVTIAAQSLTEVTIDSPPTTVVTSTTTEKITTSEGTLVKKSLDLDQVPMNDTDFEHNYLIEKRGVKVDEFKADVESTTEVGVAAESSSVEEVVVLNKSKSEASSTTPSGETTAGGVEVFAKEGGETTTTTAEKAATAEDDFEVDFEVDKKTQVVGKRESGKSGNGSIEEDTLPLEEPSGGLNGRSDDGKMPGMPYDVKPVGFKTVAPKLKQKVKEGNEDVNEGSEEDTLPIVDEGIEIPGVAMLAGRTDDLRGGLEMGVGQVGFGLKVEVVDWSSEKDELGGPWMSGEEGSVEEGLGVVDARGWGIEEWIEMPPPSPLFDAHSTLLRKQIDFELLKGGKHGDGVSGGFTPHVSVVSEKEIQFNSTWYQILSEIAATASVLIPEELFRDPFSECNDGDDGARGARKARAAKKDGKANNTSGGDGKLNNTSGGGGMPNNTSGGGGMPNNTSGGDGKPNNTTGGGGGGGSEAGSEAVIPKLPIFADLLRVFGWFTRSYESSVVIGDRVLEEIKNGFKDCRQAAEGWRQRIVLGEIGGCDAGVEIKSIKVDQPVWNEYNASYTTMERLLNFTSSSTDLPPIELRINSGKWIFAELLWYAAQLTYTFCFESFSLSDPNGFMTAYDVILRLFGSELVKGLWEEVGGNLAVFELVLPFVRRSHGGGGYSRVVMELDKISGGIKAGGFVNGFGRRRRRWEEERGGRPRNSWDESGRVLRRKRRAVEGEVASVVKVVEEEDVGTTPEPLGSVDEEMSSVSTPKSKLWLNVGVVSTLKTTTEVIPTKTTTEVSTTSTTIPTTKPKGRVFDQAGGWFVNRLLENKTVEENVVEEIEEGEVSSSSTTVVSEEETTSLPTEENIAVATEEETETTLTDTTVQPIELIEVQTEETFSASTPPPQETQPEDDLKQYEIWGGLAYCLVSQEGEDGMGGVMAKPTIGEMVENGGLIC